MRVNHAAHVEDLTIIPEDKISLEKYLEEWHGELKKNKVSEMSRTQIGRLLIDLKCIKIANTSLFRDSLEYFGKFVFCALDILYHCYVLHPHL